MKAFNSAAIFLFAFLLCLGPGFACGDDDDDDDNDGYDSGISIDGVTDSGCKEDGSKGEKADYPPQSVEFDYSNDVLTVTHRNGKFNCCYESIGVTVDLDDSTLEVREDEYTPYPCRCMCPSDVTTRISGLDNGTYTVNIYVNGTFAVDGEVTIP